MPRSVSVALIAIQLGLGLGLGCRPVDADHAGPSEPVAGPSGSVAGTEASSARDSKASSKPGSGAADLRHALVAVAAVNPTSDAEPCELVCGSLGDCLAASDRYSSSEGFGLELECLDHCEHAPDDSAAKADFLACGGSGSASGSACGSLMDCAEQRWTALASADARPARADPVPVVVEALCTDLCQWTFSCMFASAPPNEAPLEPYLVDALASCVSDCQIGTTDQQAMMQRALECIPNNCSADVIQVCFNDPF